MRFRIGAILWVFALLASSMATFGGSGILPFLAAIYLWAIFFMDEKKFSHERLVGITIFVVLAILLMPAVHSAHESVRRNQCANNMKQLVLALLTYDDVHGHFPAAAQAAPSGGSLHSWRMWIYPMLESSSFYSNYRKTEPWDSPHNTQLIAQTHLYNFCNCPNHVDTTENHSHYLAVVGQQTAWPPDRGRELSEITDGTSNTILLLEAPHKKIPWAKPADMSFDEAVELLTNPPPNNDFGHEIREGFFYQPSRGINAAFVDGSVKLLSLPLTREQAIALLTVDGGENVNFLELSSNRQFKLNYARIYSLSVFVLLTFLPAFVARKADSTRQLTADESEPLTQNRG